jgi:DNA-directed RNA polymerase specialized sigma24 family protein
MNTWIGRKLDEGPEGLAELNRHVMEVYREPLMIYFKGSSYRWMGDAEDFVQGFFADRLHKQNYLAKWRESDLQLRRYLSVGFLFYLKESQRAFLRENRASALPAEDQLVSDTGDPQVHFDRACAQALVAETIRKAEELCLEKQLGEHWRVFLLHWRDGVSYRDLAPNFGVTPQQAGGMASTGRRYFIRILREVIADQLADSRKVDQELRSLLEASES